MRTALRGDCVKSGSGVGRNEIPGANEAGPGLFITSLRSADDTRFGKIVREDWKVEAGPPQARRLGMAEDKHRHRRANVARNLALTRNALLASSPS